MEQLPTAFMLAVVPLTVQTPGLVDTKDAAKPEVAVATNASGVPTVWLAGALKLRDWPMGCESDPPPPHALSEMAATRAQARNRFFRTGWRMK